MFWRNNPNSSELVELLQSLKTANVLITYHGTTKEQAERILQHGFQAPNLFQILMDAYQYAGLDRDARRQLPKWAREFIVSDISGRFFETYNAISFAPHGVASRWAGWGGEVFHELMRNIDVIKAFMQSEYPKTEEGFDTWSETINYGSFYRNFGTPVVLKVWIQLTPEKAARIATDIEQLFRTYGADPPPTIEDAWQIWNFSYRDDKVSDLSQIIKVELADSPFTGI